MSEEKPQKLLRIKDAAERLGVTTTTLRRWDRDGKLKAVRIGSRKHPRSKNPDTQGDRRYRVGDIEKVIRE